MDKPVTHARIIEHADGSFGVLSSTGAPLGYLVEQVADDGTRELGSVATIFAVLLLVIGFALAVWHCGRWYERAYGADIHESRFSR